LKALTKRPAPCRPGRTTPLVLLALALAAPTVAQESARSGLWGGFGFGYGSRGCEGCDDRTGGFSGMGVIGGTLSDVVRIGGGTSFFARDENDATLSIGSGLFLVQVFPGRGSFYLQGGAGFATAEVGIADVQFQDEGAAFLVGLGYTADIGGSGKIALVPFANWMGTSIDFNPDLFQFGVGLVWN